MARKSDQSVGSVGSDESWSRPMSALSHHSTIPPFHLPFVPFPRDVRETKLYSTGALFPNTRTRH